jgi:hypothetical protein
MDTVFSARGEKKEEKRVITDEHGFTVEPALTSSSAKSPLLGPLRTIQLRPEEIQLRPGEKLNPMFGFPAGQAAAGGVEPESPTADPAQVEPDYQAGEGPTEAAPETAPPPPPAAPPPEEAAPVRIVNSGELLAVSRKITDKINLAYYEMKPTADPLRSGPLGVNVFTFETRETAVAENVMPRFICVTISFFESIDESLLIGSIENWGNILKNVEDVCVDNPKLRRKVSKALDKHVRHFASDSFLFIENMQTLCRLKRRYKYANDIAKLFAKFFRMAVKVMEKETEKYLAVLRIRGHINARIGGYAEGESPSDSSSDENIDH